MTHSTPDAKSESVTTNSEPKDPHVKFSSKGSPLDENFVEKFLSYDFLEISYRA